MPNSRDVDYPIVRDSDGTGFAINQEYDCGIDPRAEAEFYYRKAENLILQELKRAFCAGVRAGDDFCTRYTDDVGQFVGYSDGRILQELKDDFDVYLESRQNQKD